MQQLQVWVPRGFQEQAATPSCLVLNTLAISVLKTLLALLAAAANRTDLRISTDSSLQLSSNCNCRLWIQFHAVTVWSLHSSQTYSRTYSSTEDHEKSLWQSSAPASMFEAAQYHLKVGSNSITRTKTATEVLSRTYPSTELLGARGEASAPRSCPVTIKPYPFFLSFNQLSVFKFKILSCCRIALRMWKPVSKPHHLKNLQSPKLLGTDWQVTLTTPQWKLPPLLHFLSHI